MDNYYYFVDGMKKEQFRKYKVCDLRGMLASLGLPTDGKKSELIDRIFKVHQNMSSNEPISETEANLGVCFDFPEDMTNQNLVEAAEAVGPITIYVLDANERKCYVLFKNLDSSKSFFEKMDDFGLKNACYVTEQAVEEKAKELGLITGEQTLQDPMCKFNKTLTEPSIYWCTAK